MTFWYELDGSHERLPKDEHREVCHRFLRIVAPEVRPTAHNALSNMMLSRTLNDASATRLLRDFWRPEGANLFDVTWRDWRRR